ncbi:MAG: P-loop NTPase, partial [Deltaproteobacteria bacterium]|nr:P-loop NTPase [Deltaproteobacteria bacterium]
MPLFHCPLGAGFYEGKGCIKCGLCQAKSKEEAVAASKIMREYLRSHATDRQRLYVIKKIAVCGKGGVGKSTITSLMATTLEEYGYKVIVIDTDESNPGLYRQFGFPAQPRPLISLLSRFSNCEPTHNTEWFNLDSIHIEDIPSEFVLQKGNLFFMMVGKIEDPFQGCACTMADVTRELIKKLYIEEKQIVITDQEAGIESFGRGVEQGVDTVLTIVEPSFESMALAEKICYMAEGIGVGRIRAILNKIPSNKIEDKVIDELIDKNIRYLGAVHIDPEVSAASLMGLAI